MNTKNILLAFAAVLILIGLTKPNFSQFINRPSNNVVDKLDISKPENSDILDECQAVIDSLKNGPSDRKYDGKRLASLYLDMATLVSLDGDDQVIKDTEEIRQANKLAGVMLKLDLKGKYPDLKTSAEKLVVASIGDDHILLDKKLRQGAIDGFKALAWACNEGSK